jgi:hypothetical protein
MKSILRTKKAFHNGKVVNSARLEQYYQLNFIYETSIKFSPQQKQMHIQFKNTLNILLDGQQVRPAYKA